jgi:probable rRNA maturation factor
LKNREYVKEAPRFPSKLAGAEAAKLKKLSDAGGTKSGGCPTPTETDSSSHFGIHISDRQKDLKLSKSSTRALVLSVLDYLDAPCKEISIYFVTRRAIGKLHDQFFQDPTPTDCISFPLDQTHLGEVFVCPWVAKNYAEKKNLDVYEETSLYVVHGLLHLLGYDDLEAKARRVMRKKEKSCMRHLYEHKRFLSSK